MSHWAIQYIGQPWRPDQDCLYWYRRIKRERFGREVPLCEVDRTRLTRSAARIMAGDIEAGFGYRKTATPVEGDAVFLSQRNQPHHIGMVLLLDGKMHVLHALDGSGVVISDLHNLAVNGWNIAGYWTDEN